MQKILDRVNIEEQSEAVNKAKELADANQRLAELENILTTAYEDKILGKLSEEAYETILTKLEVAQGELRNLIEKLEKENQPPRDIVADVKFFISLAKKHYSDEDITLTHQMLLELVEGVVVHEKCKETQNQQVDVYFNHLGLIDRDILEELGVIREDKQLKRAETAKNLSKETAANVLREEVKTKKVDKNTAKKIIISEVIFQTQDSRVEIKREKGDARVPRIPALFAHFLSAVLFLMFLFADG